MSFDATWHLPVHEVERSRVEAALKRVLKEHGAKLAVDEEFDEDFDDDDGSFEFSVGLLGEAVAEHGDSPDEEPAEDGRYWCVIVVSCGDDEMPAFVTINSNEGQNRACWMAVAAIAGALSLALGGPEEPEPL